jgi:hypothetical protein
MTLLNRHRISTSLGTVALLVTMGSCGGETTDTAGVSYQLPNFDTGSGIDEDGDSVTIDDGDCDDTNPSIHPGAVETCNGVDDNCNAVTDEGTSDVDGDGICDGLDAESCDGIDNDGDGRVDEDFSDEDLDGIADCVDAEECDGIDNDGDGTVDEGYDADGDGYVQCGDVGEFDCDDSDSALNPGVAEVSGDLIDNNCDLVVDEDDFSVGDLIVTEIMANPGDLPDPDGEWFEVYNTSDRTIALNGLVFEDDGVESYQVTSSDLLLIDAGQAVAFISSPDVGASGHVYEGLSLSNGSDTLRIFVPGATADLVLDEVSWDNGSTFPDTSGAAMMLDQNFFGYAENDDGAAWCTASSTWTTMDDLGSPGTVNGGCASFDHDSDGFSVEDGDCDDDDSSRYPGAPETDPAVDNDCDGDAEEGPIAGLSLDGVSNTEQCGLLFLDATNSWDPQGDTPLSYTWELTETPLASTRTSEDLDVSGNGAAWFESDASGDYAFEVVAYDNGEAASSPQSLAVSIDPRAYNNAPVANAGANIEISEMVICNGAAIGLPYDCLPCDTRTILLDASGSADPDGDSLSYQWSLLSGNATLSTTEGMSPSLSISGAMPSSSGTSASEVVYLLLEVVDCMGSTSVTDVLTVDYTCNGN